MSCRSISAPGTVKFCAASWCLGFLVRRSLALYSRDPPKQPARKLRDPDTSKFPSQSRQLRGAQYMIVHKPSFHRPLPPWPCHPMEILPHIPSLQKQRTVWTRSDLNISQWFSIIVGFTQTNHDESLLCLHPTSPNRDFETPGHASVKSTSFVHPGTHPRLYLVKKFFQLTQRSFIRSIAG